MRNLISKPQLTPPDERGRFGAGYVRNIVETGWRCILQDFQGTNDRGIDGIILDVHKGNTTSLQFEIQIKTSTFNRDFPGKESFRAPVDKSHLALWADANIPVILVCVDIGPPAEAFWRLIQPTDKNKSILVSRRNRFDTTSRDNVLVQIRKAIPQRIPPAKGKVFPIPLNRGIREVIKEYYRREFIGKHYTENPLFGPIEFTWKGWNQITNPRRPKKQIASSLTLLPSVKAVIGLGNFPNSYRPLSTVTRGKMEQHRTFLWFDRVLTFDDRAPAWIRVSIQRQVSLPQNWAICPPDDPRRALRYKFLNVYELAKRVLPEDLEKVEQ